jgi:hypothetical protein
MSNEYNHAARTGKAMARNGVEGPLQNNTQQCILLVSNKLCSTARKIHNIKITFSLSKLSFNNEIKETYIAKVFILE